LAAWTSELDTLRTRTVMRAATAAALRRPVRLGARNMYSSCRMDAVSASLAEG
jgi:hypothetical protein